MNLSRCQHDFPTPQRISLFHNSVFRRSLLPMYQQQKYAYDIAMLVFTYKEIPVSPLQTFFFSMYENVRQKVLTYSNSFYHAKT